jgi:Dynamin family
VLEEVARAGAETIPGVELELQELGRRLHVQQLNVAVLGQFKRGKSTFVNALLGADVLPRGVLPLTSVATAVMWGDRPGIEVTSREGEVVVAGIEALPRFVTQSGEPRDHEEVVAVTVRYPAELLRSGVVLFDTPGTGSIFEQNTRAAEETLPRIDAAIFVTSAEVPFSAEERSQLSRVAENAGLLFVVVNKTDGMSEHDVDQVVGFTRRACVESLGCDVAVYPTSALTALRSRTSGGKDDPGMVRFESDLRTLLVDQKAAAIERSVTSKVLSITSRVREVVSVEVTSLALSQDEARSRLLELEGVRRRADRARRALKAVIESEVGEIVASVGEDLRRFRVETTRTLVAALQPSEDELPADTPEEIEVAAEDRLRSAVDRWRRDEEVRLDRDLRELAARVSREAGEQDEHAVNACARILEVALSPLPESEGLIERSSFSFHRIELPTVLESLLPDATRLLPRRFAARRQIRTLRERLPGLVDMYSGRMRHDLESRIRAEGDRLVASLDRHLFTTVDVLTDALGRATHVEGSTNRFVEDRRTELVDLDLRLFGFQSELRDISRPSEVADRTADLGQLPEEGQAR